MKSKELLLLVIANLSDEECDGLLNTIELIDKQKDEIHSYG